MNYYYLAASLPALSLDTPPLLSSDEFRTLCGEHLTGRDMAALSEIDAPVTAKSGNGFVREWHEREVGLRNALVRIRATRQRRDPSEYMADDPVFDTEAERAAADALTRANPKERELALDRARWAQLDELGGLNPFGARAILAYALKLRLAERWTAMNTDAGTEKVDEIVK